MRMTLYELLYKGFKKQRLNIKRVVIIYKRDVGSEKIKSKPLHGYEYRGHNFIYLICCNSKRWRVLDADGGIKKKKNRR